MNKDMEEWRKAFREAPDSTKIEVSIIMSVFNTEGLALEMRKDILSAALDAHRHACILEGIADIFEKDSTSPYPLELIIATYGLRAEERLKEKMKKFSLLWENARKEKEAKNKTS